MIKSTASAGPVELQSSPSAYYLWEFPEKPVSVRVSLDVVDRLERDVLESFRAITARGSEVGGLLLGRSEPGHTVQTIVENYELFHCDYSRGPLYLLSDEEKARLEEAIRRKKTMPGQAGAVVGFFRSNTRKDLALDEEDLDIFREYFGRPEQAFLLVKPFAAKPSLAGIFIWEDKKVRSEGSYIEFPFRRSELGKGDFAKSIVAHAPRQAEPEPEPAAAVSPVAHKTGSRAPVLPFSLKRDEEPPVAAPPLKKEERVPVAKLTPKAESAAAAESAAEPVAAPKTVAAPKPVAAPVKFVEKPRATVEKPAPPLAPLREEKPEAKPETKPEAKQDEKKEELKEEKKTARKEAPETAKKEALEPVKPAPKEPAVSEPEPELTRPTMRFESLHERSVFSGKKLWALFGGLAMLAAAGGTLYYLKSQTPVKPTIVSRLTPGFELKVDRSNGQLLVSWNRESDLIRTAQSAILSITDGVKTEDVPLDLMQLRAGSIVYSPLSENVSFKLEVKDGKRGNTRSEAVRAPATDGPTSSNSQDTAKPAGTPLAPQAQTTPAAQPAAEKPAPPEAARVDTNAAAETAQPPRPTEPPKPFSLAARIRQPEPTDLPEAPSVDPAGTTSTLRPAVPGRLPAPQIPSPPPPPQTTANAQPAQPAAPSNARIGGKAQEPKLLRRVDAVFPPMARQARVGGVVHLQASVGKDGKVKKIEVLSGPPLLRQAAIDAVQKWVYSPAILNGSPIDTVTDVDVNFNLSGR